MMGKDYPYIVKWLTHTTNDGTEKIITLTADETRDLHDELINLQAELDFTRKFIHDNGMEFELLHQYDKNLTQSESTQSGAIRQARGDAE